MPSKKSPSQIFSPTLREEFGRKKFSVLLGATDVGIGIRNAQYSNAMNSTPLLHFELPIDYPDLPIIDWNSKVTAFTHEGGQTRQIFTGAVTSVVAQEDSVIVDCTGAAALQQTRGSAYVATRNAGPDLIYAYARGAGMSHDSVRVEMTNMPYEIFEVVCPILGTPPLDQKMTIGGLTLLSSEACSINARRLGDSPILEEFSSAEVYAVVYKSAVRMYDAEQEALSDINVWLAWLSVRSTYSLATLPDGSLPSWRMDTASAHVRTGRTVFVKGLLSGRSWLRDFTVNRITGKMDISDKRLMLNSPNPPRVIDDRFRLALLSCAQAIHAEELPIKITSLWGTLEFYVGETEVPKILTEEDLKEIKASIPASLSREKKSRVKECIGGANNPPMMAKLRAQVAKDGIPLSEDEFKLLVSLRRLRNNLVHGKVSSDSMEAESVNQGISVVSRIILHSMSHPDQTTRVEDGWG